MVLQSASSVSPFNSCDFSRKSLISPSVSQSHGKRRQRRIGLIKNVRWVLLPAQACINGGNPQQHHLSAATLRGANSIVLKRFADGRDLDYAALSRIHGNDNYYSSNFGHDPIVDKLRSQLGVIHPGPSPNQINGSIFGLFALFFFVGVGFDKLWTLRKTNVGGKERNWPEGPTTLSMFLEKDLQRKESVEWVNMVLGKLWKVYRSRFENWILGLLQPLIDNLMKPDYVRRVEIKEFSLGDEPLAVRSVERRTSRRDNDLQYQIGLRYTGGANMLLNLSLKVGIVPMVMSVRVKDFDIDGELWVKLRLIPTEPWVGAVSWAFVTLPRIKFELSPFRLFNLMAIPILSTFLTKLLTADLPKLFVRPKKIVLDFERGKAVGPVPNDPKTREIQERINSFAGELSVTLLDARKLSYIFYGKTDPYVVLRLGDQVIRSKRNSLTTVIGPPGEPIWNQDFHMLVTNPKKEKLCIEVKDTLGFTDLTVGTAEVDLTSLKDTVPTDRIVALRGRWDPFGKGSAGEILLRLTYKAYVEDDEDERFEKVFIDTEALDNSDSDESYTAPSEPRKESFMDVLSALMLSEEFRGIMTSETVNTKSSDASADRDTPLSNGVSVGSVPESFGSDTSSSRGSALFWLALLTSISVIIAFNIGGSSLFNP